MVVRPCIAVLKKGREMIGWQQKYPRVEAEGKVRGVGMAVTMQGSGIAGIDTASAEVRLSDDGNYTLLLGSTDMGTGSGHYSAANGGGGAGNDTRTFHRARRRYGRFALTTPARTPPAPRMSQAWQW